MKVLLTGSTGFVGRHLVPLLGEAGYEIVYLMRSKKGFPNEIIWNFKSELPKLPTCDIVIHLAASVNFGNDINLDQYQVNTVATMKLAKFAQSCNAYFIFTSMIGVYGSNAVLINQNTPLNPDSSYSISKYLAEEIIKLFVDRYSILRMVGIYGLDGPPHLGLNVSINETVHKKNPPILKGSGQAKRNYICVDDVARWLLYLVQQHSSKKLLSKETLYLAGPEVFSIKEYLKTIIETLLPNKQLMQVDGEETSDCILSASPAPFTLITFRHYLTSLRVKDTMR